MYTVATDFSIYSEQIFRDKVNEEILLNGEKINNVRYDDDTVQD